MINKKIIATLTVLLLAGTVTSCSAPEPKETKTVEITAKPTTTPTATPTTTPLPETPKDENSFTGNLESFITYTSNYVDLTQLSTEDTSNFILYPAENGNNEQWTFTLNSNGYNYVKQQLLNSEGWVEAELENPTEETLMGTIKQGLTFDITRIKENTYNVNVFKPTNAAETNK